MPIFCKNCGVDAPNAGQCGDVAGVRHHFIEGNAGNDHPFGMELMLDELLLEPFWLYLALSCLPNTDNIESLSVQSTHPALQMHAESYSKAPCARSCTASTSQVFKSWSGSSFLDCWASSPLSHHGKGD